MSDFQDAVEYYLEKAKSAANRGSSTDLEEQLDHIESLLEHYSKKSSSNNIHEMPKDTSLSGEFENFYREVYASCTTSPNPECSILLHRYAWSGVWSGWNKNHRKLFDDLLSVVVDQYLHQNRSDTVNETVLEKTESELRSLFRLTMRALDEAHTLTDLEAIEFQFDVIFTQVRRIVRDLPKSGIIKPCETVLNLLSNLHLRPIGFRNDVIDYSIRIQSRTERDSPTEATPDELRDEMAFTARKHRLALRFKEYIENFRFVGSAWITHLHSEDIVGNERYEEFAENIVYENYSELSEIAERFLQLPGIEGYWETWELRRRMDESPDQIVSSGPAMWGWVLEFYLFQMIRVLLETGSLETDLSDENPIPEEDILRVRTSRILEKIDEFREEQVFHEKFSQPFNEVEIEAAVDRLYEFHEQRETQAEANWEETIRESEVPEHRQVQFRKNLSTEILSRFDLREVFDSLGWIRPQGEAPDDVEIESHILGRPSYPKRVFIDDPYVSQHLNTSQISSQIASSATRQWLKAFDSAELSLPEQSDLADFLIQRVDITNPICYIVDVGDERRSIVDSEHFSYQFGEGEEPLSDITVTGHLAGTPVITTRLDDVKAVIITESPKTVYDRMNGSPLSIEMIPGDEWQQRPSDSVWEKTDPELRVVVEIEYSFGIDGEGMTVVL